MAIPMNWIKQLNPARQRIGSATLFFIVIQLVHYFTLVPGPYGIFRAGLPLPFYANDCGMLMMVGPCSPYIDWFGLVADFVFWYLVIALLAPILAKAKSGKER